MTDYSQWSIKELDREIAMRRGYHAVDINENSPLKVRGQNWQILSAENKVLARGWNEEDAWKNAEMPTWASGLVYAFSLLSDIWEENENNEVHIFKTDKGGSWKCRIDGAWLHHIFVSAAKPERAICEAWLEWKDGQLVNA